MSLLVLISAALAAPPGWSVAPFGVGVYVHGKPGRGVVYSATQAAGIAAVALGSAQAYDAAVAEEADAYRGWQALSIAGVTLAAGSYLASVLDGSRLHELEKEKAKGGETARARVRAWDQARSVSAPSLAASAPSLASSTHPGREP